MYLLKGKSFWSVNIPQKSELFLVLEKLLKLRNVARNFIFFCSW
jgi:hypothetical protein